MQTHAETAIRPREPSAADDRFLPARAVWERYGVTSMSLHRWLRDAEMQFPEPTYLGRFRFWRLADLVVWEQSRPRRSRKAA